MNFVACHDVVWCFSRALQWDLSAFYLSAFCQCTEQKRNCNLSWHYGLGVFLPSPPSRSDGTDSQIDWFFFQLRLMPLIIFSDFEAGGGSFLFRPQILRSTIAPGWRQILQAGKKMETMEKTSMNQRSLHKEVHREYSKLKSFQLDDLMAIAELWQWGALHMGSSEDARCSWFGATSQLFDQPVDVLHFKTWRWRVAPYVPRVYMILSILMIDHS